MKLAVSHIAWQPEQERQALQMLQDSGFFGLEIAPTRAAGKTPYDNIADGEKYAKSVKHEFGLDICSIQSLWFGQTGTMFGAEKQHFMNYTKKAIQFANAVRAGNLVFGSPKNRIKPDNLPDEAAVPFFKELGDFAHANGTVIGLEANPSVYGTNFINHTHEALSMAKLVNSKGCRVNLDFGTIIINDEKVSDLRGQVSFISHVHISEPQLAMIQKRSEHAQLAHILKNEGYNGYVSIEMKPQSLDNVQKAMEYLQEVFT